MKTIVGLNNFAITFKTQHSNMDVHFSSKTNEWYTPQYLFDKLNDKHNFNLDVCATAESAKCKEYFTIKEDGLKQNWYGTCFMNPPYGREIKYWIKKAYEESLRGVKVVCLIPARTDTTYWHEYIFPYAKIEFLKGRIKFENGYGVKNSAPFPSAIVIFGESID